MNVWNGLITGRLCVAVEACCMLDNVSIVVIYGDEIAGWKGGPGPQLVLNLLDGTALVDHSAVHELIHQDSDPELAKAVVACEPGLYLVLPRATIPGIVQLTRDSVEDSYAYAVYSESRVGRAFLDRFKGMAVHAQELESVGWLPR